MTSTSSQLQRQSNVSHALSVGVTIARKNPFLTSSYVLGIVVCIFFSGVSLTAEQRYQYEHDISFINFEALENAKGAHYDAQHMYSETKGFFSCDDRCLIHKARMELTRCVLGNIRNIA
jgi:hypothetical protein